MSGAAERAADYAYWQLYISAIGLGVIALSLWFAGIGAFAARDAARAGTEAARIARNAERPYVVPTNPRILGHQHQDSFSVYAVHFDLTNVGRGLAVVLGYGIIEEVCSATRHGLKELHTRNGFGGFTLSPGSRWESEVGFHNFQMSLDDFRDVLTTETKTVYVHGFIRYADLFGIIRRTGFCYEMFIDDDGHANLVIDATNPALWRDQEEPHTPS